MTSPLFDMTGKVALITGSTKGIGRSIAEEMARCGAKVVISSRKADACEQVAGELQEQGFDPVEHSDRILYRDDDRCAYLPIDEEIVSRIKTGELRF